MPEQSPPPRRRPPDQAARDRIAEDLDTTLFVEAGAGSGKTSALVERVLALVMGGQVELRRSPPSPSPKRRAPSCATASGPSSRRRPRPIPTARSGSAAGWPWTSSTGRPSARCTPLPSACSPSTRSRPGSRPGSRCSTRSARRWPSTPAGRHFATSCWPTPRSNGPCCCSSPPASGPTPPCSRWPRPSTTTGTWSQERVPEAAPDPRRSTSSSSPPWRPSAHVCAEPCRDPSDKLRERLDEIAGRMAELAAIEDELDLLEALGPQANPKLPSFKVGGTREEGLLGLRPR